MFHIQRRRFGNILLLSVQGRLDALNSRDLQKALDQAFSEDGATQILLDLAGVDYMSASGLRLLKTLKEKIGTVHLITPSNRVREILQITGLDTVYHSYKTAAEALRLFHRVTNAYTRLEWGHLADLCPDVSGGDIEDWLMQIIRRQSPKSDSASFIVAGIRALAACGTTTIAEITASGDSIEPLIQSGMDGCIYIELSGADDGQIAASLQRAQALIKQWRPQLSKGLRIGLALGAPHATHPNLYRQAVAYATAEALPLCVAVAQSAAEIAFVRDGDENRFRAYRAALGLGPLASPRQTPIAYLEALGVLARRPLLLGAAYLDADDIARIKAHGCAIVYSPRAQLRFGGGRGPIAACLAAGISLYLGTGSVASAPSLNIYDELEVATALHYEQVSPADLAASLRAPLPTA